MNESRFTHLPVTRASDVPLPDENGPDIVALFPTLWRQKWIVAFVACLFGAATYGYALSFLTPMYRATTEVVFEANQNRIIDFQTVAPGFTGDAGQISSELRVLKGRRLMGSVVDRLNLTEHPQFNPRLRAPSKEDEIMAAVSNFVRSTLGLEATEASDDTRSVQTGSPEEDRQTAITLLQSDVSAINVRNTLVIEINARSSDPEMARKLADAVAENYIRNQLEVKFDATQDATAWLSERVASLQVDLEAAETKVANFSSETEVVSVEELRAFERQLKDMRDRIKIAQSATTDQEARLSSMRAASTPKERARLAEDEQLNSLLARAERDPNLSRLFEARYETVLQRREMDLRRAKAQLTSLQATEVQLAEDVEQKAKDLITLQQMSREAEATRVLYEHFLTRLNETSAQEGIHKADSRVLSDAVTPTVPFAPKKRRIAAGGFLVGAVLAAALVLLRELLRSNFRSARDLEEETGIAVLGQIPTIPVKTRPRVLQYMSEKPTSASVESLRNLRTALAMRNLDSPAQVIAVTSSVAGEGKTTTSLGLAHSFSGQDKKVLFLDGDLRRNTARQYFSGLPGKGLQSLVLERVAAEEAIFFDEDLGFAILAGDKEKVAGNPADLFSSQKFASLLGELREQYDIIIIDTPPVLLVPDPLVLARLADACILNVKWDSTSKAQVTEALRLFQSTSSQVAGLVLAQINPKTMKQYGYGGKYGAYSGYSSSYYAN